jgi:hypothetical protein
MLLLLKAQIVNLDAHPVILGMLGIGSGISARKAP